MVLALSSVVKCLPLLLIGGIALGQDAPRVPPVPAQENARPPVALVPEKNLCAARADPVAVGSVQWNGWGRDPFNTRYQPEPAIRATDVPKLSWKWAFGFQGGTEFGQPTL